MMQLESIADNGIGMSEEDQRHILSNFTKWNILMQEGNGLGWPSDC